MKIHAFLTYAALSLVIGCSGAGSKTEATPIPPHADGGITIALHAAEGSIHESLVVEQTVANTPPATDIRFVVSNATSGFHTVQDVVIAGTTSVNIPVPAANGYVLTAISSASGFTFTHYILKVGEVTGINIVANANTAVSMVLQPLVASITVPLTAGGGDPINVSLTAPKGVGFNGFMNTSTAPFLGNNVGYNNPPMFSSGSMSMNALTARNAQGVAIEGEMYFQAIYYLSPAYSTGGDEWSKWGFVYPDPFKGDANVSTHLKIPTGGLGVDVTY
jgi:hypothetical protein